MGQPSYLISVRFEFGVVQYLVYRKDGVHDIQSALIAFAGSGYGKDGTIISVEDSEIVVL